uniref:Putative secreted protein n=1 Tax=Anopheles darlingi TaxID=43151 RepID=A0A2M4DMH3_ANODA
MAPLLNPERSRTMFMLSPAHRFITLLLVSCSAYANWLSRSFHLFPILGSAWLKHVHGTGTNSGHHAAATLSGLLGYGNTHSTERSNNGQIIQW